MGKQPDLSCAGDADMQPMSRQWMARTAGVTLVSPLQSTR